MQTLYDQQQQSGESNYCILPPHAASGIIAFILILVATFSSISINALLRLGIFPPAGYTTLFYIPQLFFAAALVCGIVAVVQPEKNKLWGIVSVSIAGYALFRQAASFIIYNMNLINLF